MFDADKKHYLEVGTFKEELLKCPGIDMKEVNEICDFLKMDEKDNQHLIQIGEAVQKLFSKIRPHLNN